MTDKYSTLNSVSDKLSAYVGSLQAVIEGSDGPWGHDLEFAERAHQLRTTTKSSRILAENGDFRGAFALARTALEHQAIDSLLLLGTRREVRIADVSEAAYSAIAEQLESSPRFAEHTYLASKCRIDAVEFAGSAKHEGGNEQISFYYWAAADFSPGFLPSAVQGDVVRTKPVHDTSSEVADELRRGYRGFWTWSSLLRNLQLNSIISDFEKVQMRVHYAFLSKFSHGLAFGEGKFENSPIRPALSSRERGALAELVSLYAVNTMRLELEAFRQYAAMRPRLTAVAFHQLDAIIAEAAVATGYFWFRGGEPTNYDRLREERDRQWVDMGWSASPRGERDLSPKRSDKLADEDVRYYPDPLERLRILQATRQ